MNSFFDSLVSVLKVRAAWGPILILAGIGLFIQTAQQTLKLTEPGLLDYLGAGISLFLCFAGVILMFKQDKILRTDKDFELSVEDISSLDHAVKQLGKNYEILRSQTVQGFYLAGSFMALGFIAIIISIFGASFGLNQDSNNLASIAGILMEFISGTALLIYRLNFKRLNETSDKLDESWRILSANRLAQELPDEKKADATLKLIDSLVK